LKKNYSLKPELKGAFNIKFFVKDIKTSQMYNYTLYTGIIDEPDKNTKNYEQFGVNVAHMTNVEELIPYLKTFSIGSVKVWSAADSMTKISDRNTGLEILAPLKKAGLKTLFTINIMKPLVPAWYLIPKDFTEWSKYMKDVAGKHKGFVDYYEVLNEPNIWKGRGNNLNPEKYDFVTADGYVKVLKATYEAIKEVDKDVKIAGPATCQMDLGWLSSVLSAGGKDYIEVFYHLQYWRSIYSTSHHDRLLIRHLMFR